MSFPRLLERSIIVAMSERARRSAFEQYGAWDIVVTWEELRAVAAGVEEVQDPEARHQRLAEGLAFFAQRQGLNTLFIRGR